MRWQGAVTDREPLWRSAAVALRHLGRDDDAERLLFAAALGAVRRGDLLNAVDAARRLEAMNQRSDRIWAGIEEALKRRRFSAYAPSFELTQSPTSLEARGDDRLCADLVALVERESRAPEQPSLQRTPLLEALGEAALPWLRELQLRVVADGSPLLGPEEGSEARVEVYGDRATVELGEIMIRLTRSDGVWKVANIEQPYSYGDYYEPYW